METWSESLSESFLPLEWFNSSPNLLIKLLYRPELRQLSLLATDLEGVYYESLKGRQLNRRIDDAVASSPGETQSESIGVMAGVGLEGEDLAERVLEELVDAVRSGRAKVALKEEGFEQFIDITLPSETVFRFVLFKLERESAQILASHLIQPLLGTSTTLLSLLRQDTLNETELIGKLEPVIDSSGRAERLSQGKNCSTFFRVGGAGLLKRWEQSFVNIKSKKNDPLQLSLPDPKPTKPTPRNVVPSTSELATPPPMSSPRKESLSPSKRNGLASKMLDYRSKSTGEKIGWDDSQPEVSSAKGKGKAVEQVDEDVKMQDEARERGEEQEEEEPATDEEAEVAPQIVAVSPPPPHSSRTNPLPPPSWTSKLSPSANRSSLRPPSPSGSRLATPQPEPPSPSQDVEDKKAKKKRKAEEEEAEALERRKAKFAKMKAGGSSSKKKRGGGTRGL